MRLAPRDPNPRAPRPERRVGLALLVVMVVFVVLYMVVYHLHFYTRMEAKVSQVRHGDIQSLDAFQSVGQFVMTLLVEDLVSDYGELSDQQAGGGMGGLDGADDNKSGPGAGGGVNERELAAALGVGAAGAADTAEGNFRPSASAIGAGGGAAAGIRHVDYPHENVFKTSVQTVGEVQVKVRVYDNESRLDLMRLFGYVRAPGDEEGLVDGDGNAIDETTMVDNVLAAGDDEDAAAENLRDTLAGRGGASNRASRAAAGEDLDDESAIPLDNVAGLEDEAELNEWVPPSPEQREMTVEMLRHAIEAVLSINEDNEFNYNEKYSSDQVAEEIVQYVIERREDPVQNRIYDVSELLNLDHVTEELFYGPNIGPIPEEGYETLDGEFILTRDEFGDLEATSVYDDVFAADREAEQEQLAELQEQFGAYMDFPGLGGLNANSLTRGMKETSVVELEDGSEVAQVARLPIGLRDIFTTFSTGKVNLNTAPFPVLFALLPSLRDGGSIEDSDANYIAVKIEEYRNRMQDYVEEEEGEGIETNVAQVKDLGQPRRQLPTEEELAAEEEALNGAFTAGAGMDDILGGVGLDGASTYQDLETNYFTSLEQIELVDGTDESDEDLLRSDQGVDRVSEEDDSPLQKVLNDYGPVMVFGSTYFTVELKAKTEGSPLIKTGHLIVKRDPQKKILEVVLWKELQK